MQKIVISLSVFVKKIGTLFAGNKCKAHNFLLTLRLTDCEINFKRT